MRTLDETSLFELKRDVRRTQPIHTGFNAVKQLPTPIPESEYHKVAKSAHAANSLSNFKKHVPTLRVYHAADLNINFDEDLDSSIDIVRKLKKAGHDAYIVGGAIRDLCFGIEPTDVDISTSATPEQVQAVFKRRARIIGRRFIICLIHNFNADEPYEVSTFRRDNEEETRFSLEYANVDLGDLIQYTGAITSTTQLKALLQQRELAQEPLTRLANLTTSQARKADLQVAQAPTYALQNDLTSPQYAITVPSEVSAPAVQAAPRSASQEVLEFLQTGEPCELDIPVADSSNTQVEYRTASDVKQEATVPALPQVVSSDAHTDAQQATSAASLRSLPTSTTPEVVTTDFPDFDQESIPEYIPELDSSLIASLANEESTTLSKSARRRQRQREARLRRSLEAQQAQDQATSATNSATNTPTSTPHTSTPTRQEIAALPTPTSEVVHQAAPSPQSPFAVRKVYIGNPSAQLETHPSPSLEAATPATTPSEMELQAACADSKAELVTPACLPTTAEHANQPLSPNQDVSAKSPRQDVPSSEAQRPVGFTPELQPSREQETSSPSQLVEDVVGHVVKEAVKDVIKNVAKDKISTATDDQSPALKTQVASQVTANGATTPERNPREHSEMGNALPSPQQPTLRTPRFNEQEATSAHPSSKKAHERILKAQRRQATRLKNGVFNGLLPNSSMDLGGMAERRQALAIALEAAQHSADPTTIRKAIIDAFPEIAEKDAELLSSSLSLNQGFSKARQEVVTPPTPRTDK